MMKKTMLAILCAILALFIIGCPMDDLGGGSEQARYAQEMCGEWIRIDTGERWYISQYGITVTPQSGGNSSAMNRAVTLTKTAAQVITVNDSGKNYLLFTSRVPGISFKAKVAFVGGGGAGNFPQVKVTNTRQRLETIVQPDSNGIITVTNQIPGDTVELAPQGSEWSNVKVSVTPWVQGQDMGIIPLPLNAQGANLKASISLSSAGNIAELYADGVSRSYVIDIENIGKQNCAGASYEITWDDADFTVTGTTKATLDTITPGTKKQIPLTIVSKPITEEFKVKDIHVTIVNFDDVASKAVRWEDTVSVFYNRYNNNDGVSEQASFRINSEKPVQGVIRSPQNVTYYFKTTGYDNVLSVDLPKFSGDYIIAFLGASVEAQSETMYSLAINSNPPVNWTSLIGADQFTYDSTNKSPDTTHTLYFGTINSFMYYLYTGAVQYYKVNLGIDPASCVVTFDSNGGSDVPARGVKTGGTVIRPADPVRTGYVFGGWYSDQGLSIGYNFNTPVNTGITLYAKWLDGYTVVYNANSGNGTMEQRTVTLDATWNLPANGFTYFGCTFLGWSTTADGEVEYANTASVTRLSETPGAIVTLYAVWDTSGVTVVPGTTLSDKFTWLDSNVASSRTYVIEVTADGYLSRTLSWSGKNNITVGLRGIGAMRTVNLSGSGSLFTVSSGVTLILDDNVTLKGNGVSRDGLVIVNSGGKFVMNSGSVVTGNNYNAGKGGVVVYGGTFTMNGGTISGNSAGDGGGVYVDSSGTFTMNGGTISGNRGRGGGVYVGNCTFTMSGGTISGNTSNTTGTGGGGVYVGYNTTFIMRGGTISDNTAAGNGGGVYVASSVSYNSTFTMSGGTISGNTASGNGGGVYVSIYRSTFTMSGGTISGNTASSYGGGVYVDDASHASYSTFNKTGGTIYGYTVGDGNSNVVKNSSGNVLGNRGHAVYAVSTSKRKETSAGPNVNLYVYSTTTSGGWDN